MENQPVLDLLWRTRFRWKVHPRQFTGDTTYGTAENSVALEEQHIRAYVPLPDFEKRTTASPINVVFGVRYMSWPAWVCHPPAG